MASLQDLPQTAEKILAAFVTQLTDQAVSLPERQYVAPGAMIVWDGPQMTVALMGISQGQPGTGFSGTYTPGAENWFAMFSVNIVRVVAALGGDAPFGSEIPSADDMDSSGQEMIADAGALILAFEPARYQIIGPGEGFAMEGLQPLGPEGGLAGTRLLLSVSLT